MPQLSTVDQEKNRLAVVGHDKTKETRVSPLKCDNG